MAEVDRLHKTSETMHTPQLRHDESKTNPFDDLFIQIRLPLPRNERKLPFLSPIIRTLHMSPVNLPRHSGEIAGAQLFL